MRKTTALLLLLFVPAVYAVELMPDFAAVPTGWTTDRYDPAGFANVGTYAGRDNVLGITIDAADGLGVRGGGFDSTFYNTQGRLTPVTGGVGDTVSADLFIPISWAMETNGTRRTDMWGVATNGVGITDYPIIGFTNEGDSARWRLWDSTAWVNLAVAVAFDEWTALSIELVDSAFNYYINDVLVYSDATVNGSNQFSHIIMQAYNYNGVAGSVSDNGLGNYTAHWSNTQSTQVPVAAPLALFGIGLLGMLGLSRRQQTVDSTTI